MDVNEKIDRILDLLERVAYWSMQSRSDYECALEEIDELRMIFNAEKQ